MATAFIKFDDNDEAKGVHELVALTRVDAFRGGVYAFPEYFLDFLNTSGFRYELATDEEVEAALAAIRHPFAAPVQ